MNCPSCGRLLYSRQHRKCGHCGADLPEDCRLSESEVASMKAEQAAIAKRRALARDKEEREKQEQQRRDSGGPDFFFSGG